MNNDNDDQPLFAGESTTMAIFVVLSVLTAAGLIAWAIFG